MKKLIFQAILTTSSLLFVANLLANESVLVMTDSQYFIDQVRSERGVGTISTVYSLLYQKIGLPKKLSLVPLNRQTVMLNQLNEAACTLYRFKTKEREKRYAFSQVVYFMLHYRLYQQASMQALEPSLLSKNNNLLSLTALAANQPKSTLMILPNFSYGDELDQQIEKLPSTFTVEWTGSYAHNRLSYLFFLKRTDYSLIFPSEVKEYNRVNPNNDYRSYGIEGVPKATMGYMMCNKHKDALEYINKVNQALTLIKPQQAYLQAHLDYYEETEHATIKEVWKNSINQH